MGVLVDSRNHFKSQIIAGLLVWSGLRGPRISPHSEFDDFWVSDRLGFHDYIDTKWGLGKEAAVYAPIYNACLGKINGKMQLLFSFGRRAEQKVATKCL